MRMLKSGLKLVLDTDWIMNDEESTIEDIVSNCNVYEGSKYYYHHSYDNVDYLQNFDVKLPLNHRYIMTYYFPSDDYASTIVFDTFGLEEMYEIDPDENPDQTGYQALFFWYYNADDESVSSFDSSFSVANYGIRLNPVWMGNCTIRIYQID